MLSSVSLPRLNMNMSTQWLRRNCLIFPPAAEYSKQASIWNFTGTRRQTDNRLMGGVFIYIKKLYTLHMPIIFCHPRLKIMEGLAEQEIPFGVVSSV